MMRGPDGEPMAQARGRAFTSKATRCCFFRAALGFSFLLTTCIFFALASFRSFALRAFFYIALGANLGFFFCATTIIFFAFTRAGQRTRTRVTLFIAQCAQNNTAGRLACIG